MKNLGHLWGPHVSSFLSRSKIFPPWNKCHPPWIFRDEKWDTILSKFCGQFLHLNLGWERKSHHRLEVPAIVREYVIVPKDSVAGWNWNKKYIIRASNQEKMHKKSICQIQPQKINMEHSYHGGLVQIILTFLFMSFVAVGSFRRENLPGFFWSRVILPTECPFWGGGPPLKLEGSTYSTCFTGLRVKDT